MSQKQDLTRREASKVAVGAAAALSITGAPFISKVKAANNTVQFGFIGTGSRGQYLLQHLKGLDNGTCVAVCDVYEPNMRKGAELIGNKPKQFKDYRELLADKSVDAVLIATPLYMHFPVTKDALDAGKHVFCEKSLVFKPEEIHALRALANSKPKQTLQVGLQRRYSKFYQTAKQMIDKGMLGTVTHIRGQWHRNTFAKDPWNKPLPKDRTDKDVNWRKYREFSGGLTAELASHQIDIADWMFGSGPEYVVGVGGTDYIKDGRDIFDNIQLIFKYPKGQKLHYSSITTNRHCPLFNAERTEFGECIMGTQGTIHITVGTDSEPALGMWYMEPPLPKVDAAEKKSATFQASASLASTGKGGKALPILFEKDTVTSNDSFVDREMKFARQWLYRKGVLVPEEDRNPVDIELESFFNDVRNNTRPKADLEVGLHDSSAVMLANRCMYEERKVLFSEIDNMGKADAKAPAKKA
ncbi:Gfo/Idh/MocA family protein [Bryobacter aggregatus]|uniref:Gfo/Idh/MocA family protein n=1 Tax=Bryobacter aggregatus TaxID=360054 RepID=UPI0004E0EFC7|nr:Gfo/Idh/MocA family oxidoreductase [Bryobacter aggregatus]